MANVSTYDTSAGGNNSAPPDGFPEGQAPSTVNNAAREVMAALARWYKDANGSLTSTGSANAYLLTTNNVHATLAAQNLLVFRANFANTGAATLKVDSLTAKAIKKNHDQDLVSGDIEQNQIVVVAYNATDDVYELVSTSALMLAAIDEDDMASDSDVRVPTQQSVKAYVDVAQTVNTQTGAVATGTTVMVSDDTIPQNTEGDEYMTLAFTPTNASNILLIDVVINLSHSAIGYELMAALFQDSVADALAAASESRSNGQHTVALNFTHKMVAGTTSAITFRVRAGAAQSGTTTFNGKGGGRLFGGVYASSITIREIRA